MTADTDRRAQPATDLRPGDLVVRRGGLAAGRVTEVSGRRVRVHWLRVGNHTSLSAASLERVTAEELGERIEAHDAERQARRDACEHPTPRRRFDGSLYCLACAQVVEPAPAPERVILDGVPALAHWRFPTTVSVSYEGCAGMRVVTGASVAPALLREPTDAERADPANAAAWERLEGGR